MSETVPYAEFQMTNNVLVENGGPWRVTESSENMMTWTGQKKGFCLVYGCVCGSFVIATPDTSLTWKLSVNVSVPLAQYGNPDMVDFTFAYNLNWASDMTDAGAPLVARLTVGSYSRVDHFGASDRAWLWFSNAPTLGDPFRHSGKTLLTKSSDGSTGYIPITLDFPFRREPGSRVQWYFIGQPFRITTVTDGAPISSPTTSASGSTSSSLHSSIARTVALSSLSPPDLARHPISSASSPASSSNMPLESSPYSDPNSPASQNIASGVIIGGVLGGMSILGVFALMFFLLHRGRLLKRGQNQILGTPGAAGAGDIADESSIMASDESKPMDCPSSTASSPPLVTLNQVNAEMGDQQSDFQGGDRRRRRRRRDHWLPSSLSDLSTFRMEVPPPAYSDVSGSVAQVATRHDRCVEEGEVEECSHSNEVDIEYHSRRHDSHQTAVVRQSTPLDGATGFGDS
ncbi:hypothetical protein FRC17_007811 [Serendipita sp. 399]|nr:hypothetical protein FRC17_007811 [Serendipita sp. 399]